MQKIAPCLWFDDQAEEAAKFYVATFKKAKLGPITYYGEVGATVSGRPKGSVMTVAFEIDGQEFLALNGGPIFQFTEAVSLMVKCETQEEINHMWEALSRGGEKGQCGWLKDKYGLSWQIVPKRFMQLIGDSDPRKAKAVMEARMTMVKLDVAALEHAYDEA